MAETEELEEEAPKKKSKLPLLLGLLLAVVGGGGGFYATYSGMILGSDEHSEHADMEPETPVTNMPDVSFVPVDPLVISLNDRPSQHLRFRAQLEVKSTHQDEVEALMPRVVDVLNSYLRAVDIEDLRDNAALVRLRAQMLRRVQVVTGGGRVNDLLIMEFVLN